MLFDAERSKFVDLCSIGECIDISITNYNSYITDYERLTRGCKLVTSSQSIRSRGFALREALNPAEEGAVRIVRCRLAPAPFAIARYQSLPVPSRRECAQLIQNRVGRFVRRSRQVPGRRSRLNALPRFALPCSLSIPVVARRRFGERETDLGEGLAFAQALIADEEAAFLAMLIDLIDGGQRSRALEILPVRYRHLPGP